MNRTCPTPEQLQQLTTGRLPDPPAGELESHVLECAECQQATASLHLNDTFVNQVRDAARSGGESAATLDADDQVRVERIIVEASGLRLRDPADATVLSNSAVEQREAEQLAELAGMFQPAERDDELGRLGGFRLLKLLGTGGMGAVFLAEDMQLERLVALKSLKPEFAARKDAAGRFLREARAAAAIKHEHVVTIYQVGEVSVDRPSGKVSVPFLAQELLEGESLEDRLRHTEPLSITEAIDIARQMAEGLAAAHAKGLIHRDIKPANVWLECSPVAPRQESRGGTDAMTTLDEIDAAGTPAAERQGYVHVKLLDFGLARLAEAESQITTTGIIVGTPSYMAPEQASGDPVDARADLFSLGVVLYRLVTGELPFKGRRTLEVLKSLAVDQPAPPIQLRADISSELSDFVLRLLEKDRDQRPASAAEVARALRRMGTLARPAVPTSDDTATIEVDSKIKSGSGTDSQPTQMRTGKSAHPTTGTAEGGHPTGRWLIATALAACVLLGVIVIKLKDKDGRETKITLDVPVGTKVVSVEQPESKKTNSAPEQPDPAPTGVVGSPLDALDPAKIAADERFEWQPKELVEVVGKHAWRHWGSINGVSMNPKGTLVASVGTSDGVRLWDVANGQQLASWPGVSVAFTPDGQRLAIGGLAELIIVDVATRETRTKFKDVIKSWVIAFSRDGETLAAYSEVRKKPVIQVLDVATTKPRFQIETDSFTKYFHAIALSADGNTIAAACDEGLKLWNVESGESLTAPNTKRILRVAFSPDDTLLATWGDGGLKLWNRQDGSVHSAPADSLWTYPHLAFSPDGKSLVYGSGDKSFRTWDIKSNTVKHVFAGTERVTSPVSFSADGQFFVSGGQDAAVQLWNFATAKQVNDLSGYPAQARQIAVTPDDRILAMGGSGYGNGQVVVWDVLANHQRVVWRAEEQLNGMAIGKDGSMLATTGYQTTQFWDLPSGQKKIMPLDQNGKANSIGFAPDGTTITAVIMLAAGSYEMRTWQLSTGKLMGTIPLDKPFSSNQNWVTYSPDGSLLARCDQTTGPLQVWDMTTRKLRFEIAPTTGMPCLDPMFSRDGKRLLTVTNGGSLAPAVYDTSTGKLLATYEDASGMQGPRCAVFLRDDKTIVSAGPDGRIIEWSAPWEKRVLCQLPGPVHDLAVSSDGRHLFTANSNGTVYVLRLSASKP